MPWTYISEVDAFSKYHQIREEEEEQADNSVGDGSFLPSLGHAVAGSIGTAISNLAVYPLNLVVTRLQVQQRAPTAGVHTTACEKTGVAETQDVHHDEEAPYNSLYSAVRHIYKTEGGVPACYAGITQDTLKSMIDSFLFFLFYNLLLRLRRRKVASSSSSASSSTLSARKGSTSTGRTAAIVSRALSSVGIGMLAGAATKGLTSPLQQVITRKQTASSPSHPKDKENNSTTAILHSIYATRGLRGFWAGYSASLVLTLNPSLTMAVDGFLEKNVLRFRRKQKGATGVEEVGPALTFLLAATSKAAASCAMYPVSLAKTRAQVASASASADTINTSSSFSRPTEAEARQASARGGSVLAILPNIAHTEGIGALYAGLSGEVVKGFVSHGLTMVVKQRIQGTLVWLWIVLIAWARRRKS